MRLRFLLFVLILASRPANAQSLSVSLPLHDWGLTDIRSIVLAQFSIIHTSAGDRLEARALYDASVFPSVSRGTFTTVADFTGGFVNRLGGSYAAYGGNNGIADARHIITADRRHALAVTYDRRAGGFAGIWMHLFNSASPRRVREYFDATKFSTLAVTIRGNQGNEKVILKVADEEWLAKEDALPLGDIGRYVPGGAIKTTWSTAYIPLKDLPPRINPRRLATLVFDSFAPSAGSFELSAIAFLSDSGPLPEAAKAESSKSRPLQKALWVWETKSLFQKNQRERLLSLIKREKFDNVFLGLPYDSVTSRRKNGLTLDPATLGPIILALNAAGVRVHALTGDKDFILPENRSFVRNSLQNIVEYNRSAPPGEQFFGIHLDVEPYLFQGFGSPKQRWYVQNFLETLDECVRVAKSGNMQIGADIPPWFDSPNELTHVPMIAVLNGVSKPLYQHIIDMMDNVALMDYRTQAGGENGIVLFVTQELEYAEQAGKQVFVGLETAPLPDETILTFKQPLEMGIPKLMGENRFMIVTQKEKRMTASLIESRGELAKMLHDHSLTEQEIFSWPVDRATLVEGTVSSFANLDAAHLMAAMNEAEPTLRRYRSFAGFAIHYYKSYDELLKK